MQKIRRDLCLNKETLKNPINFLFEMTCPIKETKYHSWQTGEMALGCKQCVQGKKLVLFVTGLCAKRCFYCPVSEQKFNKDVIFANEWKIIDPQKPEELIEEAKLTDATGAGITGGDPLMRLDRTVNYIKLLKEIFGKQFHIHLYTPLKLVDEDKLKQLHEAGLDEIRFHPNLEDDTLWDRLSLAKKFKWDVGVEIPCVPGFEAMTKKLIDFMKDKVDFLNLNELELSDTKTEHNKMHEKGFKPKDDQSYAVKGSQELGMGLLKYAREKGIRAYFCTGKLKDSVQMKQRIKRRACNIALPTDEVTEEGLLIRGCIYLKDLAPGFDYQERIKKAQTKETLQQLEQLQQQFGGVVDKKKLRVLLSEKDIKEKAKEIKQQNAIPAIIEEYPTADAIETEVEFL